jgi:hypothetical protein
MIDTFPSSFPKAVQLTQAANNAGTTTDRIEQALERIRGRQLELVANPADDPQSAGRNHARSISAQLIERDHGKAPCCVNRENAASRLWFTVREI